MHSVEIVIVGAGPRGTIALERLCSNVTDIPADSPITIHLIDPFPAGAGRIWHTDQPQALLMNTVASDITVFTDPSVKCVGPIVPGPSHYQWAKGVATGNIAARREEILLEAARTLPWSYPTRPMQGEYLQWAIRHIIDRAPDNVSVVLHRCSAVAFAQKGQKYTLELSSRKSINADAVILAVGHFDTQPTARSERYAATARRLGLTYVPPANASEIDLEQIPAREPVILNGMGLNFFDYVTLLTAGRGGRFVSDVSDGLRYIRSGQEPVLLAGSGRGVPYLARAEHEEENTERYQPQFITAEVIREFRSMVRSGGADFRRDVWPLVQKETAWVFYSTLLVDDPTAVQEIWAVLSTHQWGHPEIRRTIAHLIPNPKDRLDWNAIDRPASGRSFPSRADYTDWVHQRLCVDYAASEEGPTSNALKAVGAIMRDLRDEVRQIISHRGLNGDSYRRDIDDWFSGLNNLIASGPPRSRIAELIALERAGIVTFLGPEMTVDIDDEAGFFRASSPSVCEPAVQTRALVDAFLPKNDIRATTDPLLRSMLLSEDCRPHSIPTIDSDPYQTGGIDVDEKLFRVIKADGAPHNHVYTYGPPIESVQWVTAIGARPGVNSRTLLQADTIARSILTSDLLHARDAFTHEPVSAPS
ncbi:FAD/NAD(P)-binding domain-containing protein [Rhodococcus sp. PvR099]|jgi:hypothetical protein|uniref:FAD/NAD(P)-binding protein n=1 Tax=Rhodococcus sp. PvR099 TaxID=2806602 RepID=UPI001AE2E979|nr:FAD/NAD(P)-binding protein [Rhodococcus sp. PvR099]MBP1161546.1 hypothetical protein [Rhodococcus sp. PvR099]